MTPFPYAAAYPGPRYVKSALSIFLQPSCRVWPEDESVLPDSDV